MQYLALPAGALGVESGDISGMLRALGDKEWLIEVRLASDLSVALTAIMLAPDDGKNAAVMYDGLHNPAFSAELEERLQPILPFAEYAAYAPVVPLRQSPLEAHSLGSLLASGSPLGGGAFLGLAVATGLASPLLFLYVPLGIIVVGVTGAITDGLRHHIHKRTGVTAPGED